MSKNPFGFFIISFSSVIALYFLPWSDYYPPLSYSVISFFIFAFFVCISFYFLTKELDLKKYTNVPILPKLKSHTICYVFFGVINILFIGHVPIILSAGGVEGYNSKEISTIPFIFPLYVAYVYFFGVYFFYLWLRFNNKKYIYMSLLFLLPHFLFLQRGIAFSQIFTCLLIYLFLKEKIRIKTQILLMVLLVLGTSLFGFLGEVRDGGGRYYRPITEIGGASNAYYESVASDGQFYTWLYLTSPLANFQTNVNAEKSESSQLNFEDLFFLEILPDALAKRFVDYDDLDFKYSDSRIVETLNVGTMFTRSYSIGGWIGVYIYFSFFIVFVFSYFIGIFYLGSKGSPYVVVAVAMVCNFVLLSTFDNMLSNSARVFPLYFPFILFFFKNANR